MQTPLFVFQSPPWPASHWHFPSPISHPSHFPSKWPCSSYRTIYSFLFVVYPATCRNTASSYFFPGHFILFAIYMARSCLSLKCQYGCHFATEALLGTLNIKADQIIFFISFKIIFIYSHSLSVSLCVYVCERDEWPYTCTSWHKCGGQEKTYGSQGINMASAFASWPTTLAHFTIIQFSAKFWTLLGFVLVYEFVLFVVYEWCFSLTRVKSKVMSEFKFSSRMWRIFPIFPFPHPQILE